ncbi:hypothetical protein EG827_01325 [bacterium]|nr:hypothetical protein [bacterium]
MKRMRSISPFISVILTVLVLSGSFGYTLIHHSCMHCGTEEVIATVAGTPDEERCCCSKDAGTMNHCHSAGEMVLTDDCCSHEAEWIVTDELVRTEVQNEIIPFFLAATVVAVIQDKPHTSVRLHFNDNKDIRGRDLTTMHCQIIS